jgi:hypothetical protein
MPPETCASKLPLDLQTGLKGLVKSLKHSVSRFEDVLAELSASKVPLCDVDMTPWMLGSNSEPYCCVFKKCTSSGSPKQFQDSESLLWHVYHRHFLAIEGVGKPKNPMTDQELLLTREDWEVTWQSSWEDKRMFAQEALASSVDHGYVQERLPEQRVDLSPGSLVLLQSLTQSLRLSVKANELRKSLELKLAIGRAILRLADW